MMLKRHFANGADKAPTHVEVIHSGLSPEQNFSDRLVDAGVKEGWIKVGTGNISMFRNPGKEEVVVVTFDQDYHSNNLDNQMKKRQYWLREDGQWKIIYEGSA